jgi:hypothetical protein
MRSKKKVLLASTGILIFSMGIMSAVYATGNIKKLDAWFGDIKLIKNHQQITLDTQPFIVDGTTYVPVRALSTLFNKDISWDGSTRTITITDRTDPEVETLKQQLEGKNFQISQLEAKIKLLETELSKKDSVDMDDLENDLNNDYGEYEDIQFEISLSGDEDDIQVKIYVDLDDYEDEWDDLTSSKKKDFLQDICDDILDVYPDADIEGYIKDDSSGSKLLSFSTSSSGKVSINSSSTADIDDLEDELDDDYYDYFDDIVLSIELEEDDDDITFYVNINYNTYGDEWDDLSDSQIKTFMAKIYNDIEDEFENSYIEGYVYDTYNKKNLAKYYKNSSGTVKFIRY